MTCWDVGNSAYVLLIARRLQGSRAVETFFWCGLGLLPLEACPLATALEMIQAGNQHCAFWDACPLPPFDGSRGVV